MNNKDELKGILRPTIVVQHYLGQPVKSNNLGMWYKSPFRSERTASFLVNDVKGIHDFGTSEHYDVISFIQELYRIDFISAVNKLSYDFGISQDRESSKELEKYLIKRREEEIEVKKNLNSWFNSTYIKLCEELKIWKKTMPYLKKEALALAYLKDAKMEYLIELFINATEEEKLELWKAREDIQKYI